ncbi:MAG: MarR family transcriptional regulator [Methanobacteriota archaeon]
MDDTTLDKTAGYLLALLFFYHKQLFKQDCGITGVQAAQYRLLGMLMKEGSLSMSALGTRLYISKPYMTSLVDALIKEGLVERQSDLKDRRVINITITVKGMDQLEHAKCLYKGNVKHVISGLGTQDLETLCTSAEKVSSILSKLN